MRLLYRRGAGLDIHRDSISACIRLRSGKAEAEIFEERFGTFTQQLAQLAAWLKTHKVKQVAMESTGVYWIPVWNILERPKYGFQLTLVNPAIVRALQGCKTDRIDARRIAEFLQYGLLRGSFIPPKPIRQMRELTRMRVHIQQDRNRVINRIGRLLETVNIKLGSVASNIVGKSGRAILDMLAAGSTDAERMADRALGQLRIKMSELILALDGRTDPHFRWMLTQLLRKLDALDAELAELDRKTEGDMEPHRELIERLCTIPGIEKTTARVLIAELGTDMSQFPDAAHAASWAGLCPGNAESAGKRFSGKTRQTPVPAPHSGAERLGRSTNQRLFFCCPFLPRGAKARYEEGGGGGGAPAAYYCLSGSGANGFALKDDRAMPQFVPTEELFKGRHFDREIVILCVRWYLSFKLSYRDLVTMMGERGIAMAHTTILRWVQHYSPEFEKRWKRYARSVGGSWRMDETYVRVKGEWMYLYRAVDKIGKTVDFFLSRSRDVNAAKAFLRKAMRQQRTPVKITLDAYAASHRAVADLKDSGHSPKRVRVRTSKYLNNLIEQDHRRVKQRLRPMLGLKSFKTAAVVIGGIELAEKIKKNQFKIGKLGGSRATVTEIWEAALAA